MDILNILIDRVGYTNVFNVLEGRIPGRDAHLTSFVDDDLIGEYLSELERIARVEREKGADSLYDATLELARPSEAFYRQFFPERVQKRLLDLERGFLFFHVPEHLGMVPWELMHDGTGFLSDRFYMGKNSGGFRQSRSRAGARKLRVLILADPTEDLPWARREGESLFDSLNAEVSPDLIDVQLMSGRRISRLQLLSAIRERDVIHYSGHVKYHKESGATGWLLSDGKILRAREIEQSGSRPFLVFSNGCQPAAALDRSRTDDLARAFLRAGIGNYVDTNWEIGDSEDALKFALNFYRSIFDERTIGEALHEARREARNKRGDLSWANYTLHGNPMARIFRARARRTFDASRSELKLKRVMEEYPAPIARPYAAFRLLESESPGPELLRLLSKTFRNTMFLVSAIVFGNYHYLKIRDLKLPEGQTLLELIDATFNCMALIRSLNLSLVAPGLVETLSLHRQSIQKLAAWSEQIERNQIKEEEILIHLVTFQFQLDNLLSDLSALSRNLLIYIDPRGEAATVLHGQDTRKIDAAEFQKSAERMQGLSGQTCIYNRSRRVIYAVSEFVSYDPDEQSIRFVLWQNQMSRP